jgi:hypothetical protein
VREHYKPLTEREEKLGVALRVIVTFGIVVFWSVILAYSY